jgi:hypothetical protein
MSLFEHIEKRAVAGGLIALAIIAAAGWYFLRDSSEETNAPLTELPGTTLDAVLGRDLLVALSRLKETQLDVGFFEDPVFLSLRDFGVTIAPQPVGRRNPFAAFTAPSPTSRAQQARQAPPGGVISRPPSSPPSSLPPPPPPPDGDNFNEFSF